MNPSSGTRFPYALTVVDTNVLISAALSPNGAPAALVDHLLQHARLVFTTDTFAELESRVWKPKFDRYISIESRKELLKLFRAASVWATVNSDEATKKYCRDPSDDIFLHAAVASGAKRLVSGDDDLLSLPAVAFGSTNDALRIVSPRSALNELRKLVG